MSNNFIAGTVVVLKSGSPKLTVIREATGSVVPSFIVGWFDRNTEGENHYREATVSKEALEIFR